MSSIVDYRIGRHGDLWVQMPDGMIRRATEKEWINIWQRDPALTIRLTAH
ncbi:MAG: hypothetical protein H7841_07540 [Magnetospirillum sp. WYHS-4]